MTAIEKQAQRMKIKDKIARPLSMVLSVLFVFAVLAVVLVVVIPQLGRTVDSISEGMTSFLPKVQSWIEDLFGDSKEIVAYIESLEFDWKSWLDQFKDFALSGAGSVISYTMSATMIVINGVVTFFIAFTFSLYLLSQKETLGRQCRKTI